MSLIQNLAFGDISIRAFDNEGTPWFVATDICRGLGIKNTSDALRILRDVERQKLTIDGRETNIVRDSGVYTLALRCQEALKEGTSAYNFRIWLTDEVLPAIRKTGRYEAQATITPAEQRAIQREVAIRAKKTASNYQTIYRAIKARYQIARYDQLPRTQLADCLDFIKEVELAVPEVTHTTHHEEGRCHCCGLRPLPEGSIVLHAHDAERILNFVYTWRYLFRAEIELFYHMLRSVQSPHAARFFETFNDLNLQLLEETLKRYGYDMTKLPCYLALNARK